MGNQSGKQLPKECHCIISYQVTAVHLQVFCNHVIICEQKSKNFLCNTWTSGCNFEVLQFTKQIISNYFVGVLTQYNKKSEAFQLHLGAALVCSTVSATVLDLLVASF
jgi:hypothetical protein